MSSYTVEKCYKIWDDQDGSRIEVGPDADSLGLIEIHFVDPNGKITERMVFNKDQANALQECLVEALSD